MKSFLTELKKKQKKRPLRIVFVCTANCCRSPVAEILFEKMLLSRFNSLSDMNRYIIIESAGTSYDDMPISQNSAHMLMREEGVPVRRCQRHRGRLITKIEKPDLILTMTRQQTDAVKTSVPRWADRVFTLGGFVRNKDGESGFDIPDPIGGPLSEYRRMKDRIKSDLKLLLEEAGLSGLLDR
ncbi:MAG: hypothetical protein JW881_05255 [Spirochaetales bacterium]|nr:hypothetical protein [Spirochaetales bacterium]